MSEQLIDDLIRRKFSLSVTMVDVHPFILKKDEWGCHRKDIEDEVELSQAIDDLDLFRVIVGNDTFYELYCHSCREVIVQFYTMSTHTQQIRNMV